jgi:plastocyanin
MQIRLLSIAILAACGMLACGGGGYGTDVPPPPPPPVTPASPLDIVIQNNTFTPSTLTVPVGSTVKWTWASCTGGYDPYGGSAGETCVDHNVTWDATDVPASPTQGSGTYQRLFNVAGTYNYHCSMHGAAMSGKVVVQ